MIIKRSDLGVMENIAPGVDMKTFFSEPSLSIDYIHVSPNAVEDEIIHRRTDEIIYLLEGELSAQIDGVHYTLSSGDCVILKKGTRHKFSNNTSSNIRLLAICTPAYSPLDVHITNNEQFIDQLV